MCIVCSKDEGPSNPRWGAPSAVPVPPVETIGGLCQAMLTCRELLLNSEPTKT